MFNTTYKQFYCILNENKHKWIIARSLFSYLFGVLFTIVFWKFIILGLNLNENISYPLLLICTTVFGLGCTYSRKFRCILSLIFIAFLGKAGRSFLRTLIFTFILDGPIFNLSLNSKEIVKVFACAALFTFNLTQTRFDLMTKPLQNALFAMKNENNTNAIKATFQNLDNVTNLVVQEIEMNDTTSNENIENNTIKTIKRDISMTRNTVNLSDDINQSEIYQNNYKKKLEERCKMQFKKGKKRCIAAFLEAYKKCYEKLPAILDTILCWPMKITMICNIEIFGFGSKSSKGGGICDPSDILDPNFGENYYSLQEVKNDFMANITSVNVTYDISGPKKMIANVEETTDEFVTKFKSGKRTFDKCIYIANKIFAFIFIKTIIGAIKYHNKYLKDINSDNIYITSYFKKIDKRRKEQKHHSLLPLKKVESINIIDPTGPKRSKSEKNVVFLHVLKLALELCTACIFLLIDHIIYVLLETVRTNAKIDYIQEGEHIFIIDVYGTGIIANLIRRTLKSFNVNATISTVVTNEPCLPNPVKLSKWFYLKFFLLFLTIILLIFNESFISRMKRTICSYFYPLREKRRIVHLYNQLLRKRRTLFTAIIQEIQKQLLHKRKLQMKINFITKIEIKAPFLFGWLRNFRFFRRSCLICRELEPKDMKKNPSYNFISCQNVNCFYIYCKECWTDAGEICLACNSSIFLKKDYSSKRTHT